MNSFKKEKNIFAEMNFFYFFIFIFQIFFELKTIEKKFDKKRYNNLHLLDYSYYLTHKYCSDLSA